MRRIRWSRIGAGGNLSHVGASVLGGRRHVEAHGHDFAEVFWIRSGAGIHQVNGLRHPLRTNDLCTIAPGDVHSIRARGGEGLSLVNVAFPAETLAFLVRRYFDGSRRIWGGGAGPVRLAQAQREWLDAAAEALGREARSRLEIDRFLVNLLSEAQRTGPEVRVAGAPPWLRNACREFVLQRRFDRGVGALAELARRSPEHVARTLKRTAGLTPMEFVTNARMTHAATQLRLSGQSIIEIAMGCGYGSLSRFYAVFRRRFGTSPRQYRLRQHAPLPSGR
jgi:AraC family cel operon transcriptional repressor